ncbi:unnamed protein product, partial [Durusdinium trenchii]
MYSTAWPWSQAVHICLLACVPMEIGCSSEQERMRPVGQAQEPSGLVLNPEKVSKQWPSFQNHVSFVSVNSQDSKVEKVEDECLESLECRSLAWEVETESSEASPTSTGA